MSHLSIEVRGDLNVTYWHAGFDWLAHDTAISWVYGAAKSPLGAVCDLIRKLVWQQVNAPEWRNEHRRTTDAFRVIRDQQQHIRSLEAQLLPNLIREVPAEQDAML